MQVRRDRIDADLAALDQVCNRYEHCVLDARQADDLPEPLAHGHQPLGEREQPMHEVTECLVRLGDEQLPARHRARSSIPRVAGFCFGHDGAAYGAAQALV